MKIRVIDPALSGPHLVDALCLPRLRPALSEITEMSLAEYQAEQHQAALCPDCAAKRREQ